MGAKDMRVRQVARSPEDGFQSGLLPGLRASADARRLAEEIAFSVARLDELSRDPPGLYGVIAGEPDDEHAFLLAFLIAYLSPLEDPDDPWRAIRTAAASDPPSLGGAETGPRGVHRPENGTRTLGAYLAWAQRSGSQSAAFFGEGGWSAERRFARALERLALPAFPRAARFELLVSLGRLGRCELRAGTLALGGADETTIAAKRVFGIADVLLLERRSAALAEALGIPLEALDLALYNWDAGDRRATLGSRATASPTLVEELALALGL
ncbi:MAG: hypothetical protein ACR2HD_09810 [Solirubrobacteraceae bacterium]